MTRSAQDVFAAEPSQQGRQGSHLLVAGGDGAHCRWSAPENPLLSGRAAFSAGLAAASYVIGWKWPKARKLVGIFNMTVGSGFAAAAIGNTIRNPYYKP